LSRGAAAASTPPAAADKAVAPARRSEGFFLLKKGARTGPFSFSQLQRRADQRDLRPKDLVLPPGAIEWLPARQIPALSFPAPSPFLKLLGLGGGICKGMVRLVLWLSRDKRRWIPLGASACVVVLVLVILSSMSEDPNLASAQNNLSAQQPGGQTVRSDEEKQVRTAGGATSPEERLSGQKIYEKTLRSTVWINNPGLGFGSGALVNAEDKLVLTNYHVVFRPQSLFKGTLLQTFNGSLTPMDPRDALGFPFKLYDVAFSRGQIYVIDMESRQFDCYLQVVNAAGNILAEDDDSGGNSNARVRFVPPVDGMYRIMATTYDGGVGAFTVKVSQIELKKGYRLARPGGGPVRLCQLRRPREGQAHFRQEPLFEAHQRG
jgi:hypothetical protein